MEFVEKQAFGPALYQAHGIVVESEPGHSVALAMAIKEGRPVICT